MSTIFDQSYLDDLLTSWIVRASRCIESYDVKAAGSLVIEGLLLGISVTECNKYNRRCSRDVIEFYAIPRSREHAYRSIAPYARFGHDVIVRRTKFCDVIEFGPFKSDVAPDFPARHPTD